MSARNSQGSPVAGNESPREQYAPRSPRQTPFPQAGQTAGAFETPVQGQGNELQTPPRPQTPQGAQGQGTSAPDTQSQQGMAAGVEPATKDIVRDRLKAGTGLLYGLEKVGGSGSYNRAKARQELEDRGAPGHLTVDRLNNKMKSGGQGFPYISSFPSDQSVQEDQELSAHVAHQRTVDSRFPRGRRLSTLGPKAASFDDEAEEDLIKRNNRAAMSSETPVFFELQGLNGPQGKKPGYTESEARFAARNQHRLPGVSYYQDGNKLSEDEATKRLAPYSGPSDSDIEDDLYFPEQVAQGAPAQLGTPQSTPTTAMAGSPAMQRQRQSPSSFSLETGSPPPFSFDIGSHQGNSTAAATESPHQGQGAPGTSSPLQGRASPAPGKGSRESKP